MTENKKPEYKRLDYKEMEQLVADYQQGDTGAALKLMDGFRGYMTKFQQIICGGTVNLKDTSSRAFIGLFIYNGAKTAASFNHIPNASNDFHSTISLIREIFSQFDQEEIEQELTCTLLRMAKRHSYNLEYPRFHMYIKKVYHFYLYRQLKKLSPNMEISMSIDETGHTVSMDMDEIDNKEVVFNKEIDDDIDENWIAGITCSDIFKELTPLERRILKMHYTDRMADEKIGEKIGRSRGTVLRIRNEVKKKIASTYVVHQL